MQTTFSSTKRSSSISINFIVPQGWHELSDKQLRYVYQLIADDFATDDKSCQREQSQARLDYAECSRQCDAIELLDQLGATLYGKAMTFKPYERISIFYWFAALKKTSRANSRSSSSALLPKRLTAMTFSQSAPPPGATCSASPRHRSRTL